MIPKLHCALPSCSNWTFIGTQMTQGNLKLLFICLFPSAADIMVFFEMTFFCFNTGLVVAGAEFPNCSNVNKV